MKFFKLLIGLCCYAITITAQVPQANEKLPVNKLDGQGKRDGRWKIVQPARMGEPATTELGLYVHGRKNGAWYKMDENGDLVAVETFRNGVLDGEVKYYDRGALYCIGHYRGLNINQRYDTIVVTNPITQDESFKTISTDQGTMRHGMWRYFDPLTGALVKEEEYQVDELIYQKEFTISASADSLYMKKHQANMPHNKDGNYKPPATKQYSYTDY